MIDVATWDFGFTGGWAPTISNRWLGGHTLGDGKKSRNHIRRHSPWGPGVVYSAILTLYFVKTYENIELQEMNNESNAHPPNIKQNDVFRMSHG